jgi:5-methylcytosine-specific restriction endonuclease McrA
VKHNSLECDCKACKRKNVFLKLELIKAKKANSQYGNNKSRFQVNRKVRQVGNSRKTAHGLRNERSGPTQEELVWRITVLTRDGFKCVFCGATERLEADHIKPKSLYPELKLDISNGRTLCNPCHKKTPTYGTKVKKLIAIEEEPLDYKRHK